MRYNKYELVSCFSYYVLSIYKRYYIRHKYKIIVSINTMLLVRKVLSNNYINSQLEKNIINIIKFYSRQYYHHNFIYIDFTSTIKNINDIAKLNKTILKINDSNITWRIRQAFIQAMAQRNQEVRKEYV